MGFKKDTFKEVSKERDYQLTKYGTDFDDKNTYGDWASYVSAYVSSANLGVNNSAAECRTSLIKTMTLCLAALEALERNGSFPDNRS